MVYPAPFYRVVAIGNQFGDTFNTTFSLVPISGSLAWEVAQDELLCQGVAGALQTWWNAGFSGTNPNILSQAKLTSVKVNLIGIDGKYVYPATHETVFGTPVSGGGTGNAAPQLSIVHTLETGVLRGLASRGRMYMPPTTSVNAVATDGRVNTTATQNSADALRLLFQNVNTTAASLPTGDEKIFRVGVASNTRAGAFRPVTMVSVGRVVDTMRARRSSLDEDRRNSSALTL